MEKVMLLMVGELATKGHNRPQFVKILFKNTRQALSDFDVKVIKFHDHLNVFYDDALEEAVLARVKAIAGISKITIATKLARGEADFEALLAHALMTFTRLTGTFRLVVRRADKQYRYRSTEIIDHLAPAILAANPALKVNLTTPDTTYQVDVRQDGIFVSSAVYRGLGGYPRGSIGKTMLLLSGGIDSPVAGYLALRRGLEIELLHFATPPYTSSLMIDKVKTLARQLLPFQPRIHLHIVPFTAVMMAFKGVVARPYTITIMRRMMYRIASRFALARGINSLTTGESIGQVASQTLESIRVIDEVSSLPVLRPLALVDKMEIIHLAQKIGTYETSIMPVQDCCTVFVPDQPVIKPTPGEAEQNEAKLEVEALVQATVAAIETLIIE